MNEVEDISKQLGHASVNTTESFYSHIIEENKAKASECIANVLLRKKAAKSSAELHGVALDLLTQNREMGNFVLHPEVRKIPDFLAKSGMILVAEAGLEPTTSGL